MAFFVFLLAGCEKRGPDPVPGTIVAGDYYLPVIETTDIHGYIVGNRNGSIEYRMAYVADKVKDVRSSTGEYREDRLLLLDGGDLYQGATVSNLLAGRPIYVAMDKMDYDAVALGNHEFDWNFEDMVDADATLLDYEQNGQNCFNGVPVLCANLFRNGDRVSCTGDYAIVEKTAVNAKGGAVKIKLGIIGFAIDYASSIMTSKFTGLGYSIKEDYSIANEIASRLESSGQCDATVLLIHGAADRAAENLGQGSAIDLVLGGHTHTTMAGKSRSGIAYLQGGRYCEHYASADIRFSVDENENVSFAGVDNGKIVTVSGQKQEDFDEDIVAVSNDAISATAELRNEVLGYITVDATSYGISGSGGRASVMSNWMCDILRRIGEADVSFVNGGGVRTYFPLGGQSRRNITVSDVYEMFPFNNTTYVYDLSYSELLELFEYSLTNAGQSLFTSMTGIDCHFRDYSVVALVKDGSEIYRNGRWTGSWASQRVILAVSEYLATSQRVDNYTGMGNPLLEWNGTDRLLFNDLVDNDNAILVLREEAAASGGRLYIDTSPHFIED